MREARVKERGFVQQAASPEITGRKKKEFLPPFLKSRDGKRKKTPQYQVES